MAEKNLSGNAELQLGIEEKQGRGDSLAGAESSREWYSRGYLPHCDRIGLLQSITFRLADSLPQDVLKRLELEIAYVAKERRELHRRKLIEKYMDSGMGCCALKHPVVADMVQSAFLSFDGVKYRLIAWCIMPNHVHVLIEPLIEVRKIVQSWKSFTGRWVMRRNAELELGVPGKSAVEGAIEFLTNLLADGPMSSAQVITEATADGHSCRTIGRAKKELGILAVKGGMQKGWMCQLPPKSAKIAEECQTNMMATFGDVGTLKGGDVPIDLSGCDSNGEWS